MDIAWDRGTLLLHGPEAVADLPGVLWDPRVAAWRAPARLHHALTRELRERGVAVADRARETLPSPAPFAVPDLRPYQAAAHSAWEIAGGRGVVALPTGAGKTRTATAAIARSRARALVLVPTRVLLDQWHRALVEAGCPEVGRFGDGDRLEAPVTVATYASAQRNVEHLGNRFDLLVVDECHHFGGGAGDECLEMSTARLRLGLTATPPGDAPRLERLDALVGPVVYRSAIGDLAGRFLSPFEVIVLSLDLSPEERAAYEAEMAVYRPAARQFFDTAPGADWTDFVRAASRSDAGRRALAAWRRSRAMLRYTQAKRRATDRLLARHAGSRVLVFAADARTAFAIAREQLAPVITADVGRAERARVLERFARGELRVLVSARVLNEGVDVPQADVAIVVGGAQGEREYVQRVGRVLRPAAGKRAVVYELVTLDTHEVAQGDRRRRGLAAG